MAYVNMKVSEISFNCGLSEYRGIILSETEGILLAANFSDSLDIDGYSIIAKNRIEKISSQGGKFDFWGRVLKVRSTCVESNLEIMARASMKNVLAALQGIVGIDFSCDAKNGEVLGYSLGYVEALKKSSVDIRFVNTLGKVDWGAPDSLPFSDVVKIEWGKNYFKAFELLHEKSRSLIFKEWNHRRISKLSQK